MIRYNGTQMTRTGRMMADKGRGNADCHDFHDRGMIRKEMERR